MVLAKALDDICPTFEIESAEDRKRLIQERIEAFEVYERELDEDWELLEKSAYDEIERFEQERDEIFDKIAKTDNAERVLRKVQSFEKKRAARVEYLHRRLERELASINGKIPLFKEGSKKQEQLYHRLDFLKEQYEDKIRRAEHRYNTIIKNTLNSENSERVKARLENSRQVWKRKFNELEERHRTQEDIFNNKSMVFDQIRIALKGFEEELDYFKHWCIIADVPLRLCYKEAIRRARMVKRDTSRLEEVLRKIIEEGI